MRGVRVHLIPSSFLSRQVGSLYSEPAEKAIYLLKKFEEKN